MRNKFFNIRSFFCMSLVMMQCFIGAGCGKNPTSGSSVLSIQIYKGGYGTEWLDEMIKLYK